MAASCLSLSVHSSAGVLSPTVARDGALSKQTGRISFASASISGASVAVLGGALTLSLFSPAGSRAERNAAIAARAADLDQSLDLGLDLEELSAGASIEDSAPPPPPLQGTKLYVGNLPWSVHSKQLAEVFQQVGNVELVEVIYDRDTQKSRGFAFVTMSTNEDANRAIERLDGSELDGRIVKVNFPATSRDGPRREFGSRPPRFGGSSMGGPGGFQQNQEHKLFVGNLSWGVDDVSLDELFSEYGKVVDAKVIHDRQTGRSRGFGFVTLSSSQEVNHAISSLDGAEFDGRQLRVNLAGDKPPPRNHVIFKLDHVLSS